LAAARACSCARRRSDSSKDCRGRGQNVGRGEKASESSTSDPHELRQKGTGWEGAETDLLPSLQRSFSALDPLDKFLQPLPLPVELLPFPPEMNDVIPSGSDDGDLALFGKRRKTVDEAGGRVGLVGLQRLVSRGTAVWETKEGSQPSVAETGGLSRQRYKEIKEGRQSYKRTLRAGTASLNPSNPSFKPDRYLSSSALCLSSAS
jgi:hypothetical protein